MAFNIDSISLHKSFVKEYIRDYDAIAALLRLGFSRDEAFQSLEAVWYSSTVQCELMDYRDQFAQHVKADAEIYRSRLIEHQYKQAITTDLKKLELPGVLTDSREMDDVTPVDIQFTVIDARD